MLKHSKIFDSRLSIRYQLMPSENLDTYHGRLDHAQRERGFSYIDLARIIGIDLFTIRQLCTKSTKTSEHNSALAKSLNVSPRWLLGEEPAHTEVITYADYLKFRIKISTKDYESSGLKCLQGAEMAYRDALEKLSWYPIVPIPDSTEVSP